MNTPRWIERLPVSHMLTKKRLPILLRYLLPLLSGLVLLVLSFFYLVRYYQLGEAYTQTLFNFYKNTLTSFRTYIASGSTAAGTNALYGWIAAGAVIGILAYLGGMFFAAFSFLCAFTVWKNPEETDDVREVKIRFKILFPNRVCLFLSNCLLLLTTLFPSFFALVASKVSGASRKEVFFLEYNIPLIVTASLLLITLVLSVIASKKEVEEGLDPFVLKAPLSQNNQT